MSTWEAAASEALESIVPWTDATKTQDEYLAAVTDVFEQSFTSLGKLAVWGWLAAKKHKTFLVSDHKHIVDVLASKQHDYGHENILKHGIDGVRVRIWDKIARLRNLVGRRDVHAKNESIIDSWLDLIGYSVIGVMLERGTFTLPLAADAKEDGPVQFRLTSPQCPTKTVSLDDLQPQFGNALSTLLSGVDGAPVALTMKWDTGIEWTYERA